MGKAAAMPPTYITKTRRYEKSTDRTAGADLQAQDLQEERTGDDVLPRRDEGRCLEELPALDKAMPTHDEGARGYGLRQKPPVPAQGGGGGNSEASGGTVLGVPSDVFFAGDLKFAEKHLYFIRKILFFVKSINNK